MKNTNLERIKKEIISTALLRGCAVGCAAAAIILVLGVSSTYWYIMRSAVTYLSLAFLLIAVFAFWRGGAASYKKIANEIYYAEQAYGGSFNAEPIQEFADSGYFYTTGKFLIWYRDLTYYIWHQCGIARIDNVGRKTQPGNQIALVRITSRHGRELVLPYQLHPAHHFMIELVDWVNPDARKKEEVPEELPESKTCSSCGAVNRGTALFCAYCGSELKPAQESADVHERSLADMGYVPLEEIPGSVQTNPVSGTAAVHRSSEPSYSRINIDEQRRQNITFWILFAALIVLAVIIMIIFRQAGQPHYW